MTLHRPESLDAALRLMAEGAGPLVAGGTDLYPGLLDGPPPAGLIDVTRIAGLRGISQGGGFWRIGGATTWSDVLRAGLPPLFDGLKSAAREVGSVQIQNAGTVAGNVVNASPAADGVPALLALDAEVEVTGAEGARRLPLSAFITGVRRTDLRPGEIVSAVLVPDRPGRGSFVKLGARRYLVISIAMVSAVVEMRAGRIADAAVAIGACSPVAVRQPALEAALRGCGRQDVARAVAGSDLAGIAPIDDIRASAVYRAEAVRTLCTRAIGAAMETPHVA